MNNHSHNMIRRLTDLGISHEDALTLRRCAMTLHRWHEQECGDGNDYCSWAIERDEETQIPYRVTYPHKGETVRHRIPDRETGAVKRIAKVLGNYTGLSFYLQTDPRGAPLYSLRPGDVPDGEAAEAYYNRGIAVHQ